MRAAERLYGFLPAIHRVRDAEAGYPLQALLAVIGEQLDRVAGDVEQLYDDWFVETCQEWLLPYIGDLVGYSPAYEAGEPADPRTAQGGLRQRILFPRQDVADTVRNRRRRGTFALLPELATAVSGWPARGVEMHRLLAVQQSLVHPRSRRGALVDLRASTGLAALGGAFETAAHLVDTRRLTAASALGRYAPTATAVFLWRLRSYPVTRRQAYAQEAAGPHAFTFSAFGVDTPLFVRPEPGAPHPDRPVRTSLQVPAPITRRLLEQHLDQLYGPDGSLQLWWVPPAPPGSRGSASSRLPPLTPVPADRVIVADLTDWSYRTPRDRVAVDPELGRIAFPPASSQLPRRLSVSYSYGFAADLGGGEYDRPVARLADDTVVFRVGADQPLRRIAEALAEWADQAPRHAVIEVADSAVYVEPVNIELAEGQSLWLRAAPGCAPVLRLLDWQTDQPDSLSVGGGPSSCLTVEGFVIAGRGLRAWGQLGRLNLRHSTLVPGWSLDAHCEPRRPAEASLELDDVDAEVEIEHCILGTIRVIHDEVRQDPVPIRLRDSVLDATGFRREALGAPGGRAAHARLTLRRCTVIGRLFVHAVELAENSILAGRMIVARRQEGCVRFSFVSAGSRTPRQVGCVSDAQQPRLRPAFASVRYGTSGYARLDRTGPPELLTGADDAAELGVYHDLFDPQREANVAARLRESIPAGLDAAAVLLT